MTLRRFVTTPVAEPDEPAVPSSPAAERCEMCAAHIDARHNHVVDVEHRLLQCTCRSCWLLFTHAGAAEGRWRAVPDRYLHDPALSLSPEEWEALQVPVGLAFFLDSSAAGRVTAFYPSPGGATECLLDLDEWQRLAAAYPLLREAEPDVEALLVHRSGEGFECFVVPVDACYELVGAVRLHWRGFDGGAEAHGLVDRFFADLRARCTAYAGRA